MIVWAPTIRPPPPRPWTARKRINSFIVWLKPARADPIMKMTMAAWKKNLRPNWSPSFPHNGVDTVEARRYAVTTHARCDPPWRSPTMVGSAVETMVWSSAASNMPSRRAPRMNHRRRLVISSTAGGASIVIPTSSRSSCSSESSCNFLCQDGQALHHDASPLPAHALHGSAQRHQPCIEDLLAVLEKRRSDGDHGPAAIRGVFAPFDQPGVGQLCCHQAGRRGGATLPLGQLGHRKRAVHGHDGKCRQVARGQDALVHEDAQTTGHLFVVLGAAGQASVGKQEIKGLLVHRGFRLSRAFGLTGRGNPGREECAVRHNAFIIELC